MSEGTGAMRRIWQKLFTSAAESDTDDRETGLHAAGQPISDCRDRDRVCVTGRITALSGSPANERPTLTAEINDGSASLDVVWLGRRSIPGIEIGHQVRLQGRIATRDGRRRMYNPRYDLIS